MNQDIDQILATFARAIGALTATVLVLGVYLNFALNRIKASEAAIKRTEARLKELAESTAEGFDIQTDHDNAVTADILSLQRTIAATDARLSRIEQPRPWNGMGGRI